MKYLLFINFSSGLMHNKIYDALNDLHESVEQFIESESLGIRTERLPSIGNLRRYLQKDDDYFQELSNGSWYHIQSDPVFGQKLSKAS